jgi:hypothetical protein
VALRGRLGGDQFVRFLSKIEAVRVGEKRSVTFVPGSVAARLVDPTFTDSLNKCSQRQSLEAQYVRARLQEYSDRCTSPTTMAKCGPRLIGC